MGFVKNVIVFYSICFSFVPVLVLLSFSPNCGEERKHDYRSFYLASEQSLLLYQSKESRKKNECLLKKENIKNTMFVW